MNSNTKPFIKWIGGKGSIINELTTRLPKGYTDYFEPFIGGGALFFNVNSPTAHFFNANLPSMHISDLNKRLIMTYIEVRDNVEEVIIQLKEYKKQHSKEYYYASRKIFNNPETIKDTTTIAALFIYLNKTCFNGIYRVNSSGGFNVPIGSYVEPEILNEEALYKAADALNGVEILNHSFEDTPIIKNAFYYFDPPYHETFSDYNDNGFSDKLHEQLANFCQQIDEIGGYFMLSNSDTDFIAKLYSNFNIENVAAMRSVSRNPTDRRRTNELLIRNYK